MPTYTITAPENFLTPDAKQRLAREITRIHAEVTGAPTCFAQVIFSDVKTGNYFLGGKPLADDHVYIHGRIRGGRSIEMKQRLLTAIQIATAELVARPKSHVWVYILDLAAKQMAEFGHIMPDPGDEAAWMAALPAADRARMEQIGLR